MTLNSIGTENSVWAGGQAYIEMFPRTWYPVNSGDTIENQFPRPIILSEVNPTLVAYTTPVEDNEYAGYGPTGLGENGSPIVPRQFQDAGITWPSPHFRAEHTFHTILAGEKVTIAKDAFIMSSHYRLQPISNGLIAEPVSAGDSGGGITNVTTTPEGTLRVLPGYDDPTNGAAGFYIKYWTAANVIVDGATVTSTYLGAFTDELLSNPYTPINPTDIESTNAPLIANQYMITLENDVWRPTGFTRSFTVRVITVGDVNTPPTFTDFDSNVTPLVDGEVFTYDSIDVNLGQSLVTANVGDQLKITYLDVRS